MKIEQYTKRLRYVLGVSKTPGRTEREHTERYKFASEYVKGKKVLDIACGIGYGTRFMKESGATSVIGADISQDALNYARRNNKIAGVDFVWCNAGEKCHLGNFDVVISFETIEHVDNYIRMLRNIYDMLNPGGLLIISTPNRPITSPDALSLDDKPANDYHVREFTLDEFIQAIRTCGFGVADDGMLGQSEGQIFKNRLSRKYSQLFDLEDPRYGPRVQFINNVPKLKYIVVVARKHQT